MLFSLHLSSRRLSSFRLRRHSASAFSTLRSAHLSKNRLNAQGVNSQDVFCCANESASDKERGIAFLTSARHFINLTNGIEALPVLQDLGLPYTFVRIQSTACEQQNFEQLLNGLDSTFLLSLALGETCIVYDFGSRNKKRGVPRAIWYGVEFIHFALDYIWFGNIKPAVLRGHNVEDTFKVHVNNLSKSTKKKLKYYRQYIPEHVHGVQILGIYGPTVHDPDQIFYRCAAGPSAITPGLPIGLHHGANGVAGGRRGCCAVAVYHAEVACDRSLAVARLALHAEVTCDRSLAVARLTLHGEVACDRFLAVARLALHAEVTCD
ncbi:hypothetical protein CYMTET_49260 [Cymbomonas tetramitiformis]|uniref:Uncharacterized protein n=1 Tax=Cymbomonas tetramitiformis TaxID=36881 RepID=A0AAE0EVY7_9CHLO|nr:hypothetical protein CYMTET_49260 [Cymbomonas tetramitiformis]